MPRRAPSPQKRAFGAQEGLQSGRGEVARSGNCHTRFLMVCVRCRWHHSPLSRSPGEGQNDQMSRLFRMVGSRVVPLLARRLSGLNDMLGRPQGKARVCESESVRELLLEPYIRKLKGNQTLGSGRVEHLECFFLPRANVRLVRDAR